ncbi:agmatine deiminase family protein [Mycobacterium sp. CBMA293]|uniref:agmatine deiminase family protein n=1 Tax=unclassified Mycolicibacterium TaxID=2636767 RepID=UPI0012DF376A|nr:MULTISPECIES: agmatine deiminase family protein [unclassified Mycolicibacterium]MUL46677.1 agmatine deiminase family protein [Mycolicibacterium sp. CBMA 360]MUL59022.1 agmatine deiminase family protein [Mycolicibacterium sp. CBMA 335]MUL69416.1 agmatine deiminase family protein [Mycolicibacterium sp. CBMA 311]MUL94380.1 agmatine deiminase family protein [Mycolicibacterium sp. CBMA 230]MUM06604.1 agmatine deiminase [Mycolicibacterium sp. CBMA 213]
MRRRRFFQAGMATIGTVVLAGCDEPAPQGASTNQGGSWVMPDEGEPHKRTWMAFGPSERIWGRRLLPQVRRDLATVAVTIARFEPVSMLVRAEEMDLARSLIGAANVELIAAPIDDLWIRDTGPVFVKGADSWGGVDFNFNGWGGKQDHRRDAKVAEFVAGRAGVPAVHTDLVLEGGGIEVDGQGTAIITESCVLNDNRNPGRTKPAVEAELGRVLGVQKVIWLPGIAGHDITDGHTDFYARFAGPGVVVAGLDTDPKSFDYDVTRRHLDLLHAATDAHDRPLRVEVIEGPSTVREKFENDDFAAGYINFYVCNGAVIGPEFGDPDADTAAKATLERLFPGRQVVQINIDAIAAGGGGIHCTTAQEPAR